MSKSIQRNTGLLTFGSVADMRAFVGGSGLKNGETVYLHDSTNPGNWEWSTSSSATDDGVDVVKITSWSGAGRFLRLKPNAENSRYNQGGTGAVDTTVKAKLQETVSVKDFGAAGDGVTDDAAKMQVALDSGAAYVYLPNGIFMAGTALDIPSNVTFFGPGTIKSNADGVQCVNTASASNIVIRGITFDGNASIQTSASQKHVEFTACSNVVLEDCKFTNSKWQNVIFHDSDQVRIRDCYFYEANGNQVNLFGCEDCSVTGNLFYNYGGDGAAGNRAGSAIKCSNEGGVTSDGCKNVLISDNVMRNGTDTAIYIGGGTGETTEQITVSNNQMYYIGKSGINITGSNDCVVSGNNITYIGGAGINCTPGGNPSTVKRNLIKGNKINGTGKNFTVRDSIVSLDETSYGLHAENNEDCTWEGNEVFDVDVGTGGSAGNGAGMYCRIVLDTSIIENRFKDSGAEGIVFDDAQYCFVRGNIIDGAVGPGISISGYDAGSGVVNSNYTSIENNRIRDVGGSLTTYGIRVFSTADNTKVVRNEIITTATLTAVNAITDAGTGTAVDGNIIDSGVIALSTGSQQDIMGFHVGTQSNAVTIRGLLGVVSSPYRFRIFCDSACAFNHADGAANFPFLLSGATNWTAAAGDMIEFDFDGTNWREVSRSDNS